VYQNIRSYIIPVLEGPTKVSSPNDAFNNAFVTLDYPGVKEEDVEASMFVYWDILIRYAPHIGGGFEDFETFEYKLDLIRRFDEAKGAPSSQLKYEFYGSLYEDLFWREQLLYAHTPEEAKFISRVTFDFKFKEERESILHLAFIISMVYSFSLSDFCMYYNYTLSEVKRWKEFIDQRKEEKFRIAIMLAATFLRSYEEDLRRKNIINLLI